MSRSIVRNRVRPPARTGQKETGRPSTRRSAVALPHQGTAELLPGALSPRPTGLPVLRTSERGTFKRCHWKWWWEFERKLKPTVDVPPLRFGTLMHQALAVRYKPGIRRGPHPRITFERLYEEDLKLVAKETKRSPREIEDDGGWGEHAELGVDMLDNYIDRYGTDEQYKVIVTEFPFQRLVYRDTEPWFWYVGVLDGVWQDRVSGRFLIPDHKTTRAINLRYLKLDDQATAYWTWGVDALLEAGMIPNNTLPLHGMLFNFMRKAKKDTRPQDKEGRYLNKDMTVSQKQPSPYHHRELVLRDWTERDNARRRVMEEMLSMEGIRQLADAQQNGRDMIPGAPFKNPGQFTCPGCWLFDICELHEIGADWRELASLTTKSWDPYAQHEILESR